MRKDRNFDQLRDIVFETNVNLHAEGSCLVKFGNTHVVCTASIDEKTPPWLRGSGKGWVTAQYGMLPRSTNTRIDREAAKGKQSGRTQEIQRLIGRSLRSVTSLEDLGERQIKIDCDVIQADGGTRTASISGGFVALYQAVDKIRKNYNIQKKIAWKTNNCPKSKKLLETNIFINIKNNIDNVGNEIVRKCLISPSILKIFKLIYININILNLR